MANVIRFSVARMISVTGTRASWIALVSVVYARTGSGAWVSAALVVQFGVSALSAPWAGALGDRFRCLFVQQRGLGGRAAADGASQVNSR